MLPKKKKHTKVKDGLHPMNRHRERYDFKQLISTCPNLEQFVVMNKYDDETVDFANPSAVKMLNTALLMHYYDIEKWEIPEGYLCPPIPGRADYIHRIADLLRAANYGKTPTGKTIKCLDVGVGANCIYPIIGHKEYGWSFIGSEVDTVAVEAARNIVIANSSLKDAVEIRIQKNQRDIFYHLIEPDERIDVVVCNPPFHASQEAAEAGTLRKLNNLNAKKTTKPVLNFGGKSSELWCHGGEGKFVANMIRESKNFSKSCFWFSTLISKQSNLKRVHEALERAKAVEIRTLPMGQGNKMSRVVAWTFLTTEEQKEWRDTRWNTKPKK